jgi:hypothetical protein
MTDKLKEATKYFENDGHDQEMPYAINWDEKMKIVLDAARSTITPPDMQGSLIVSDADIEAVWGNANFGGNTNKREIILDTLLKYARGYITGSTATNICQDLGLIKNYRTNKDIVWTDKGEEYIRTLLDQAINAGDLESLKRDVHCAFAHSHFDDETAKECIEQGHYGYSNGCQSAIDWAIDHLAPRIVREGWQDICDCPDDGTMFLAWDDKCGMFVCKFEDGFYKCVPYGICNPYVNPYHRSIVAVDKPTHWMPLPQPPASKGDK